MEELVGQVARTACTLVEGMSALVVTHGACDALVRLIRLAAVPSAMHGARQEIWRRFGSWLLFGLEFALWPTSSRPSSQQGSSRSTRLADERTLVAWGRARSG